MAEVAAAGGQWLVATLPGGRRGSGRRRPSGDPGDPSLPDPVTVHWDRPTRALLRGRRQWGLALPPRPWRPRPARSCAEPVSAAVARSTRHVVVGLDADQRHLVERLVGDRALDLGEVPGALQTLARWDVLDRVLAEMTARTEQHRPRPTDLFGALDVLQEHGDLTRPARGQDQRVASVRTVARRLIRHGDHDKAAQLLDRVVGPWALPPESGFAALAAHVRTSASGVADPELVDAAGAALRGADRQLARGDLDQAAELLVVGAGLLLHLDLHAESGTSPLVDDPAAHLAPLRRSRAMRRLAAPTVLHPTTSTDQPLATGVTRAVVLPGAYPRFAAPILEGLSQEKGVEVTELDPSRHLGGLRTLSLDPRLVKLRLRSTDPHLPEDLRDPAELSAEMGVLAPYLETLRGADLVVADWADKGALWATLFARPEARVVVRVHGVDAFGLWIHALDWSRVDTMISVSDHQARLVEAVLRDGPVGRRAPRCQVVHNVTRLPQTDAAPARDPHLLGVIGWGKPVKDPLWAVEVLAELRRRGAGDWRLRLVGPGFGHERAPFRQRYAERLTRRLGQPDVEGAVELVPETQDVAHEVAQLGFVLSSSRRESFHLGLVEGVLGGAVPVVRDWPLFAADGGAGDLFPRDWVVSTPDQGADRIWALRAEDDRDAAAASALASVRERFDADRTQAQLVDVILGRD